MSVHDVRALPADRHLMVVQFMKEQQAAFEVAPAKPDVYLEPNPRSHLSPPAMSRKENRRMVRRSTRWRDVVASAN